MSAARPVRGAAQAAQFDQLAGRARFRGCADEGSQSASRA